jgi:hypothetical protein
MCLGIVGFARFQRTVRELCLLQTMHCMWVMCDWRCWRCELVDWILTSSSMNLLLFGQPKPSGCEKEGRPGCGTCNHGRLCCSGCTPALSRRTAWRRISPIPLWMIVMAAEECADQADRESYWNRMAGQNEAKRPQLDLL